MPRLSVFLDPDCILDGEKIQLSERESHHLVRVLRCRTGQSVRALDGQGQILETELESNCGKTAMLNVLSRAGASPANPQKILAFALPKGKTTESILKGAVELGASRLFPILTDHVEGRPGDKPDKWNLTLQEALKQSNNPWLPILHPLISLEEFIQCGWFTAEDIALASLQENPIPYLTWLQSRKNAPTPPKSLGILIGPEGDFSQREYQLLQDRGVTPVSLGPHVLRTETAALVSLAVCSSVFDQ